MTFRWLPDAELDAHPRLTWFIEYVFDLALSALFRIEPIYPPDYHLPPGTLVVSNHQRDIDVPIIAPVLCRRQGMRFNWPLPFLASREDLFRHDFLAEYLHAWPRPVRRVLGRISLGRFFRAMRVEPIRRVREFSLAEAFADLPHADDDRQWLNARGRYERDTQNTIDVDERNKLPERRAWGLRRLHCEARRTLAPEFRAIVDAQLQRFAGLLDAGRVVYLAPEGRNSRNGRFGRMRAGAWELVQRSAEPPPILPLALSYDALQPGRRVRAIVQVGTPLQAYAANDRGDFDSMLETQIRKLYPFNTSHLISRFLVAGPDTFTTDDFAHWLSYARDQLAAARFMLDPRLAHSDCGALAVKRLAWLRRAGLVTRADDGWNNRWPQDSAPSWRTPACIVRYCDNTLEDYRQALAPQMKLQP